MKWFVYTVLGLLVWASVPIADPAEAADGKVEVDVELFLAVDVSRSMTPRELEIQRRGYAEALVSKPVVDAIMSGLLGRVAITYVEWAGQNSQRVVVDWTVISDRASAQAFASKLTAHFQDSLRRTSISGALDYGARSIEANNFTANRRVIDVSGDGPNNHGRPVLAARAEVLARGIVINGLPLMTREGMGSMWHLEDLDDYYRHCVIGGPGAFVVPVLKWSNFPEAVRRKLVLELAGWPAPGPPAAPVVKAQANGYDCLVGEKMWMNFRRDWLQ